jgi:predicted peptidase
MPLRQLALVTLAATICAADYGTAKPEQAALITTLPSGVVEQPVRMPWRLFVPVGADPAKPLPLVVFLHGAGMRGEDNVGPMSLAWSFITPAAQRAHPCFVLAPQVRLGHRWVGQDFNKGSYAADAVAISDEMRTALTLVEQTIAAHPIDARRVYVVGQSMGGYGAWDAMIRRPALWAAGVPICGAGDPSKAQSIAAIPIWAWHGEKDTAVPVSGTRDMIAALTATGATPQYTEIAKGGHGVWNQAFATAALYDWLFSQVQP